MKSDIALQKFSEGYNCAQAVLFAFSEELGLDPDTALRVAFGFGGGMGRMQEVCGALTGGIMVLGFRYGSTEKSNTAAKDDTYNRVRALMEGFAQKHGSCLCRNILGGCDLKTGQGQKQFREQEMLNRICKPCVRTVVETLEGMSASKGA